VINGYDAYVTETSKALQLSLLHHLGLPYPRARVINHPARAPEAAQGFRFPVIVKPNIGGSGAGIRRFETPEGLEQAAHTGPLELGIDQTALVQEYIPPDERRIVRVEVLGGRYLYAIRIYTPGDSFNLCPADVCQTVGGAELVRAACPVDAPKNNLRVAGYTPPPEIVDQVECIMQAAHTDVGVVEYLIDARDGRLCYLDIHAAALAAVTERLELMIAVRPTFHPAALAAKQSANIDRISGGRVTLNVVSSWWADEARQYGVEFDQHDARYARTGEWLAVVSGMWAEPRFSFAGKYYRVENAILEPKPLSRPRPTLYAGGESEAAKQLIARACDAYLMHGDPPERIAAKVADLRARRERLRLPPLRFGVAGYVVCRPTEAA